MAALPGFYDTTGRLLSKNEQDSFTNAFTELAKKYSHPLGQFSRADHRILNCTGKSGITPISSPPNGIIETSPQLTSRNKMKEYQKSRFRRFTTAELVKLNAIEALDRGEYRDELRYTTLIHPVFSREKWYVEGDVPRHCGFVPLLGDFGGLWCADNPIVWDLLKPIIRLASRILSNEYQYAWLDTLFNGKLTKVGKVNNKALLILDPRTENQRRISLDANEIPNIFTNNLKDKIKFQIACGYTEGASDLPGGRYNGNAFTTQGKWGNHSVVTIAVQLLEPLLRDDLTDAERLGNQVSVARVLLHELAHAVWRVIVDKRFKKPCLEPYYDTESLSELGFSFTQSIFGGEPTSMLRSEYWKGGPANPHIGLWAQQWFTVINKNYKSSGGAPPRIRPVPNQDVDPFYTRDHWVLPTSWSTNMFKNDYWSAGVARHNHDFIHMGPLKHGYRTLESGARAGGNRGPAKIEGNGSGSGFLYQEKPGDYVVFKTSMTANERAAKTVESQRTVQAGLIYEALSKKRKRNPSPSSSSPGTSYGSTSVSPEPDDFVGPLELPKVVRYTCPRYDEIRQYMIDNRAPGRLALDTMTILSEPQFFRYVRDCGGINLTGLEFRNFLAVADQKGELFIWEPFPGRGVVMRRKYGWPQAPSSPPPSDSDEEPSEFAQDLEMLMSDEGSVAVPGHQGKIYENWGENRDVDISYFHTAMKIIDKSTWGMSERDFKDIIDEVIGLGSAYLAHEPKGIIRMIYPIAPHHRASASRFTRDRMADLERRAQLQISR